MKILYSYNKNGYEEAYWEKELQCVNNADYKIRPFNHGHYIDSSKIIRAQLLDNAFFFQDKKLINLYQKVTQIIDEEKIDVLVVDNCFPYHPEFLKSLKILKVIRTSDGPMASYDRDFAYIHYYDLVLYHSPAYSQHLTYPQKLTELGVNSHKFWPHSSFRAMRDEFLTADNLFKHERDIDVIFIGALHFDKMPIIAKLKRVLGKRLLFHGLSNIKRNIYFNLKYALPGWVTPIAGKDHARLYKRSKIGINIHNRGDYTVGSYRMFDLPANGVMQISDGGKYLEYFFDIGSEIVSYKSIDELLELIRFYLDNDSERNRIALNGFKKVLNQYDINKMLLDLISNIKNVQK
jgi:hypothetical protein